MNFLRAAFWICLVAAVPALHAGAAESDVPVAVAEFDNYDTSGESEERTAEYAARVRGFAGLIGERLASEGGFRIVTLSCAAPPCSAGHMAPDDLVAAARQAGARLLVYGGVHKMSTLIQMGKVQVVDLQEDTLLMDQSFSFRGDSDTAFDRAAQFIVDYVADLSPAD